jgi:hypothetical protein
MGTSMAELRGASLLAGVIVVASLVPVHSAAAQGDSPTAPPPAASRHFVFEVASGASAKGVPLKFILQAAYNQCNDQYWSGAPAWLDSANFQRPD